MLASLVARYHQLGEHEVDRYGAWSGALQKLRADWQAGTRTLSPHDYLADVPDSQRAEALHDLIAEHLRLAWAAGPGPTLDAYMLSDLPVELIEDEFLARYQLPHGDAPSLDGYRQRFPTRPEVLRLLAPRFLSDGSYVKLRKIGLGALGVVWEAHDAQLHRRVAIKEPRTDIPNPADALRCFIAEALLTAGLEHPGIVAVHEMHDGAEPFYVMRLVTGCTFGERIAEYHQFTAWDRRLAWQQLLESLIRICDAIAYAHSRGVLHRDLKPANIILGEHGNTAVLDWGNDAVAGTPDYMAPEQVDRIADERTDVFGLGAVLYELLTSRSPHGWAEGVRPHDWQRLVREAHFEKPRRLNPQIPRVLEAICLKALSRDPTARYQTAAELARDLRCHIAGEPVSALPSVWAALRRRFGVV